MGLLSTVGDLALVVIGFSLIIFIHELGHFAAARWAGIRVLAFAIGFGPALFSYRKGLGFRRGSSEKEYKRLVAADGAGVSSIGGLGAGSPGACIRKSAEVSPTEYRLNVLPLGGYVKMLGQDDSDPSAVSNEPDSFTRAPVYKRMVVISAGVVMNLITAALLFVVVFSVGLRTESAVIGTVVPGSAAEQAVCNPEGQTLRGLQPGDIVRWVDGERIEAFKDIQLAVAMSRKGRPIDVVVERPGYGNGERGLRFTAMPKVDPVSGMLALGIEPKPTGRIREVAPKDHGTAVARLNGMGAPGVGPGMTLVDDAGKLLDAAWLQRTAAASNGEPFQTRWRSGDDGPVNTARLTPRLQLQSAAVERSGTPIETLHLAGLTPLMAVGAVGEGAPAAAAGIRTGDAFARLGDVQWPSVDDGMRQISSPGRKKIAVTVLRAGRLIDMGEVELRDRRIGIDVTTTANTASYVTRFPVGKVSIAGKPRTDRFPAEAAEVPAGSRIVRIGDTPTPTLRDVRWVMQQLIAAAQGGPVEIALTIEPPVPPGQTPVTASRVLRLTPDDAAAVAALGWESPIPASWFELEEIVIQRTNPLAAVGKGLDETRKMLLTTYLTFARLFQGSVKVEHLKGPIGIADVGTRLAGKGFIWLLFFMAAVSVNLAVVNFLPLPIVDGGHFCFLLWEQFTGRPVSVAVQNVSALVGLAVIGAVFLLTTYNDLANLLWR